MTATAKTASSASAKEWTQAGDQDAPTIPSLDTHPLGSPTLVVTVMDALIAPPLDALPPWPPLPVVKVVEAELVPRRRRGLATVTRLRREGIGKCPPTAPWTMKGAIRRKTGPRGAAFPPTVLHDIKATSPPVPMVLSRMLVVVLMIVAGVIMTMLRAAAGAATTAFPPSPPPPRPLSPTPHPRNWTEDKGGRGSTRSEERAGLGVKTRGRRRDTGTPNRALEELSPRKSTSQTRVPMVAGMVDGAMAAVLIFNTTVGGEKRPDAVDLKTPPWKTECAGNSGVEWGTLVKRAVVECWRLTISLGKTRCFSHKAEQPPTEKMGSPTPGAAAARLWLWSCIKIDIPILIIKMDMMVSMTVFVYGVLQVILYLIYVEVLVAWRREESKEKNAKGSRCQGLE
jgi:hypothetical protein